MLNVIVIYKAKNSIEVDLLESEYDQIFRDKIDVSKVKRHKTKTELNKDINEFLSKDKK